MCEEGVEAEAKDEEERKREGWRGEAVTSRENGDLSGRGITPPTCASP
jgi:hypothetical protein